MCMHTQGRAPGRKHILTQPSQVTTVSARHAVGKMREMRESQTGVRGGRLSPRDCRGLSTSQSERETSCDS